MVDLALLTRPGCGLCEEFQTEFAAWAVGRNLPALRLQDVDSDPLLQRRYGLKIPVLLLDSVRVCATHFEPTELERLLRPRGNR